MNSFHAGLADVYENIERRLGDKAWMLPFAVAAGSFLISKTIMHKSMGRSLVSGAMSGVSAAGLMGAAKSATHSNP